MEVRMVAEAEDPWTWPSGMELRAWGIALTRAALARRAIVASILDVLIIMSDCVVL